MHFTPIQKNYLFCVFSLFNFSSIFPGGQLTPFSPMRTTMLMVDSNTYA